MTVQLHDCIDKDSLVSRIATDSNDRLVVVGGWVGKNKYGPHAIDFFYHLCSNGKWTVYHDTHQEHLLSKDEIQGAIKYAKFMSWSIIETRAINSPFSSAEFICLGMKP